jgi:hypothetical protein
MSELHTLIWIKFERWWLCETEFKIHTAHTVELFFLIPQYFIPVGLDFIRRLCMGWSVNSRQFLITLWSCTKLKIKMALGTGNRFGSLLGCRNLSQEPYCWSYASYAFALLNTRLTSELGKNMRSARRNALMTQKFK